MSINNNKNDDNRIDYLVERFNQIESGEKSATQFAQENFFASQHKSDEYLSSIEAFMLEGQKGLRNDYLETFNKKLNAELGMSKNPMKVQVLSKEEQEVLKENFAQTVQPVGGNVQLLGQLRTNISPLIDAYFYNNSILNDVTLMPLGEDTETITDITNERGSIASDELTGDAYEDNTSVVDTITPSIRVSDTQEISMKLNEVQNPIYAATNVARMMRAVNNQIENMIIGASGSATNGANQFWAIMNNQTAAGQNRGSMPVTLPITAGSRPLNHLDAINVVLGDLPIFDLADTESFTPCCNWTTAVKLMRVADANNQLYFDKGSRTISNLLTGAKIRVVNNNSLPTDVVGVWKLSSYMLKMSRMPRFQTRVSSLRDARIELCMDTYADGTPSMAYKAILAKNGFRHFTLKADYSV